MKHTRLVSGLALALAMVSVPALAAAADVPTSLTLTVLNTCNSGGNNFVLRSGAQVIATLNGGSDCICTPAVRTITTSDPAVLALLGAPGCTPFTVSTTTGSYLAWARVDVAYSESGNSRVCVFDQNGGTCGEPNLCTAGYASYGVTSWASSPPDSDADGQNDCVDPDIDGDGIPNGTDNCPRTANANQADPNQDGIGLACQDPDGDGLESPLDNCPADSNPTQTDTDGNGTGDACQPTVVAVPWQGSEAKSHEVYSGGALVLQAVAGNPAGAPLALTSASWDPGDGTGVQAISVANSLALELTHTYNGAVGQPFTATIRAVDSANNVYTDTMKVVIKANVRETRVNMAIDKGLWNLHKRLQRTTSDGFPSGYWVGPGGWDFTTTASTVQAFEVNGHRESGDGAKDPFVADVTRGLRYILSAEHGHVTRLEAGTQNGNNPDANGNGYGLIVLGAGGHASYTGGPFMDALVASGTPNKVAATGQATFVRGRTYRDIVQDMLDGYSWGMADNTGGWHYDYQGTSGNNDTSASHWWAIGVLASEVWGLDAPAWVKNIQWTVGVPLMQAFSPPANCQFGYTNSQSPLWDDGTNTTAAGLIMMSADDVPKTHARFTCAMAYLDARFGASMGNFYTMYQLTKAMRTALDVTGATSPIALLNGTRDWYAEYADHLVANQAAYGTGEFRSTVGIAGSQIQGDMATSWGVIMLTPSLFELPPTAACSVDANLVCQAGAAGGCNTTGADPYATVHLDGSASTPGDNAIATYSWNFQDNTALSTAVTTSHRWDNVGTYNVQLTVTDIKGNASSVVCPVQVTQSALPPVADAGGPYTICQGDSLVLNGGGSVGRGSDITQYAWDWTSPINFAANDATGVTTGNVGPIFSAQGLHTYSVALKVTDAANQSTTSFTEITVIAADDPSCNKPPVAIASPDGSTFECSLPAGAVVTLNGGTSSDPDGDALTYLWSAADAADSVTPIGTGATANATADFGAHSFTLTVTDPSGASASDPASFTVVDTTAPSVSCTSGSAECAGARTSVTVTGSATDLCEVATSLTSDAPAAGYPFGSTNVTFTGTDTTGNNASKMCTATVVDTTAPAVAPNAGDSVFECGVESYNELGAVASDICVGDVTASVVADSSLVDTTKVGTYVVDYSAVDGHTNTGHATRSVTVEDNTPPTITCPAPATAECTGNLAATVAAIAAHASDLCAGAVSVSTPSAASLGLGINLVTQTATDAAGHTATCESTITVVDTTAPAIQCPADVTAECNAAGKATGVDSGAASAQDVCGTVSVTDPAKADYAVGTTTSVTHTAVDQAGLSAECSNVITVRDTTAPSVVCAGGQAECVGPSGTPVATSGSVSDVCDSSVELTDNAQASYALGTTTVTYSATDASNNASSCEAVATVVDTTPPVVTLSAPAAPVPAGGCRHHDDDDDDHHDDRHGDDHGDGHRGDHHDNHDDSNHDGRHDDDDHDCDGDHDHDCDDDDAPAPSAPVASPIQLACGQAYVEPGASAADICDADVQVVISGAVDSSNPGSYELTYSGTDASNNKGSAVRTVNVARLFSDTSIMWDEPLARRGFHPDTDPSLQADGNPATNIKYKFEAGRTIPVKIEVADFSGRELGSRAGLSAHITVYTDIDCDGAEEGGDVTIATQYNGEGLPGGMMEREHDEDEAEFQYNLSTKNFPKASGCFIIEITAMSSGACNDDVSERVLIQRK